MALIIIFSKANNTSCWRCLHIVSYIKHIIIIIIIIIIIVIIIINRNNNNNNNKFLFIINLNSLQMSSNKPFKDCF